MGAITKIAKPLFWISQKYTFQILQESSFEFTNEPIHFVLRFWKPLFWILGEQLFWILQKPSFWISQEPVVMNALHVGRQVHSTTWKRNSLHQTKSDHCIVFPCYWQTHSLHWLLLLKLDWCDPGWWGWFLAMLVFKTPMMARAWSKF